MTALFLLVFVVQLLVYGFHELTESGLLPIDNGYWHLVTEPYGPEGTFGQWLTYSMTCCRWAGWHGRSSTQASPDRQAEQVRIDYKALVAAAPESQR